MSTMTNEEIIKVVQAHSNGEKIEYNDICEGCWFNATGPVWNFRDVRYRVKQLTLEEFIEELENENGDGGHFDSNHIQGVRHACTMIQRHMKKLQGE